MVLKAKTGANQVQGDVQQENQGAPVTAVATTGPKEIANGGGNIADLNAGVLEGIDGLDTANRYTIDGTEFLLKNKNKAVKELQVQVSFGRRLYQYWDEDSNLCQSFDGKTSEDGLVCATCEHKRNKECKFKFELRWYEIDDDTQEPEEVIITLPTVSATQFVDYVKTLAKKGLGVGQVVTKMTIERIQNDKANTRYSRVKFESLGIAQ
jgi:hypothetical protein